MKKIYGFTLVELMVVLTVIGLLLSVVVPDYVGRVRRAEEAVLKENLVVMRDALDKHYADAGKYPRSLDDLVSKRYLRAIPAGSLHPVARNVGRGAAERFEQGRGVRRAQQREGL